jgi:hypothetical protein
MGMRTVLSAYWRVRLNVFFHARRGGQQVEWNNPPTGTCFANSL